MRNLDVLRDDPLTLYDAIVDPKEEPRRSRLRGLRQRVACAYLRYYAHAPALERQRPLGHRIGAEEAADLRYCYASSRAKASAVYERMYAKILATSYFCAYCGIVQSTTIDHYLPQDGKSSYPELAILPANLVPSCNPCNTPRGFRDAAGRRALIHPYFDRVRQERLLFADVSVIGGEIEVAFRVDLTRCSDLAFGQLYQRHVGLLGLRDRYRVRAMDPDDGLPDIKRTLQIWGRGKPRGEVTALLLDDARDRERGRGANHFSTALTYGAAASASFVDLCLGSTS